MAYDVERHDFIVVGSGIAGLYTALQLDQLGEVKVITKSEVKESSTQYAQGGIAAVLEKGDSYKLHIEDTLEAGAGFCDEEAVELLVTEGPERVRELIDLGTQFDYIEGELDLAKEGAHSRRRVLHARGDATGEEIRESLTNAVMRKGIGLEEQVFLKEILTSDDSAVGCLCWDKKSQSTKVYLTSHLILASGGCGQVYSNTTNPEVTTGDGVALAYRTGAEIADMEFIQFHPTALHRPDGQSFLISETVRGEGALLKNQDGERFMVGKHEDAELAPRDLVSRAIMEEIEKSDLPHVWLDITHKSRDFLEGRFPRIFHTLQDMGIDMSREMIPVIPSAHYMIGGIKTDLDGRTSIPGLYACGEVASTGVHGANRLASNSLLEGLVFGKRIYRVIADEMRDEKETKDIDESTLDFDSLTDEKPTDIKKKTESIRGEMKEKMMEKAGISRKESELKELIDWLETEIDELSDISIIDQDFWELQNMLRTGLLIAESALWREESRGTHFREDHPTSKQGYSDLHIVFNPREAEGEDVNHEIQEY